MLPMMLFGFMVGLPVTGHTIPCAHMQKLSTWPAQLPCNRAATGRRHSSLERGFSMSQTRFCMACSWHI